MTTYFKNIKNGVIASVGENFGCSEIDETEYNTILDVIHNRPTSPDGYGYHLREDLTWELYELPVVEVSEDDEISTEEAYNIIMGVE